MNVEVQEDRLTLTLHLTWSERLRWACRLLLGRPVTLILQPSMRAARAYSEALKTYRKNLLAKHLAAARARWHKVC